MNWKILSVGALLSLSVAAQAALIPLKVPVFDPATNKYKGPSVIADSIDNQSAGENLGSGLQFRDRIYNYDLALDSNGRAYVLYADPQPTVLNSPLPVDLKKEKSNIVLALETAQGWNKTILSTEGHYQNTAIQLAMDGDDRLHMTYIRKTTKRTHGGPIDVEYLIYRTLANGVLSPEIEVGDFDSGNFAGLGSWRTQIGLAPDGQVYMIREGATDDLKTPYLRLLKPDEHGHWQEERIMNLSGHNWFLLGEFKIDAAGGAHVIYGDYGFDENGQEYTAQNGWPDVKYKGYHRLWYAYAPSLSGTVAWRKIELDEDPSDPVPSLLSDQFWVDLITDENNMPAVAKWRWRVGTEFPGYNTDTIFFRQLNRTNNTWIAARTTRTFDDLDYKKEGHLAGMGPGLAKSRHGWHGVWDSSHPRPFEHSYQRGGIMYRFSPNGQDWTNYQPLAPFSGEGRSKVLIDSRNRLNVLVLGDHIDSQLYLLRYQLPGDNLMEVYPDRRYYFNGENVTFHVEIRPGAVGDYYAAVISAARPEIYQESEIWQMTPSLTWEKIPGLENLSAVIRLDSGLKLTMPLMVMGKQAPFDKPDTLYHIYSVVAKPGTNVLDERNWVTPLSVREFKLNTTIPPQ
jgi:hypothetical protein